MEAATPLRQPHVRTVGDRLAIDGLVVEDECAVRLVRERERTGEDTVKTVREAVEIGARVLDREQAAANAEFVKTEFERASREVQNEFAEKARTIAEFFEQQFEDVFDADNGQLARELERRFGDGSAVSVQNRVREAVAETLTRSREDLVRQFSAADERNPLADFKSAAVRSITEAAARSDETQRVLLAQLGELKKELQALLEPLREYNGDKLVVALDPEAGTLPLELGYRLARARVLMKRADGDGIDAGAVRDTVERALGALTEERRVKLHLTGAKTGIDRAYELVETMGARVRALLAEIDTLVRPGDEEPAAPREDQLEL